MKKLSIILISTLVALAACTKSKEVHPEIGDGNDEIVTVGVKDVHVEYTRTDHAELSKVMFHYCPTDANGNAQQFEATEMTKKETFFELTLNDLLNDTLYWYYYELFPNDGDAFNTAQKTFQTQAFEQPEPPTPPTPPSDVPEGAINGLFTINENGDQVYFSKGNLQYQASTNTWRFAENQWNFVGSDAYGNVIENGIRSDNEQISSTYNGWIDLFGWGTSGYNYGAVCYQPWSTSTSWSSYGPSSGSGNLTGMSDWGYNAISNGGNTENCGWRTLSVSEWYYMLYSRPTLSGIRFAKAIVNNVRGLILLPYDWDSTKFNLNHVNEGHFHFHDVDIITITDWTNCLEANGAVFLPAAGLRWETSCDFNTFGFYWLGTYDDLGDAYVVRFDNDELYPTIDYPYYPLIRCSGCSVRLVQDAN